MRWMWIDRIVEFEPERRLVAIKNVSLAEEHLHDHFPAEPGRDALPVMPASLLIEGMAQTSGILVGSASRFREKVILAKIARAVFDADVFPGQSVRFDATLERIDGQGASTVGAVERCPSGTGAWESIGRVELIFSHLDRSGIGAGLPPGNFVFGENFRTILRATDVPLPDAEA